MTTLNDTSPVNASQAQVYTDLNSLQQIKTLGKNDKNAALEKIAHQFESMMMQMMMKSMRDANAVFAEGDMTSGSETKFYQDMSDNQLTLSMSKGKGMGIAAAFIRQLQGRFEKNGAVAAPVDRSVSQLLRGALMAQATGSDADTNDAAVTGTNRIANTNAGAVSPTIQEAIYRLFGDAANTAALSGEKSTVALDGTPQNFVEQLRPAAERVAQQIGVDSRVLLSQSALETGWGQKVLQCPDGSSSFNFFNIKAGDNWNGPVVTVPTIEYQNGVAVREIAKFRAYGSPEEGFADYAKLVTENPRYQQAMQCADDPRAYVHALAQSGYATDPHYAQKVLAVLDSEPMSQSRGR